MSGPIIALDETGELYDPTAAFPAPTRDLIRAAWVALVKLDSLFWDKYHGSNGPGWQEAQRLYGALEGSGFLSAVQLMTLGRDM